LGLFLKFYNIGNLASFFEKLAKLVKILLEKPKKKIQNFPNSFGHKNDKML
jgi:hypothetical protein